MKNDNSTYHIPSNVLWRKEAGKVVVFEEISGEPYILDEIGSSIWELCKEHVSVSEIISDLINQYEGDPELIKKETEAFLNNLQKNRLLKKD